MCAYNFFSHKGCYSSSKSIIPGSLWWDSTTFKYKKKVTERKGLPEAKYKA